jgi:ATP-dependent protease HslVU (ClpYQ) peptidase subunit
MAIFFTSDDIPVIDGILTTAWGERGIEKFIEESITPSDRFKVLGVYSTDDIEQIRPLLEKLEMSAEDIKQNPEKIIAVLRQAEEMGMDASSAVFSLYRIMQNNLRLPKFSSKILQSVGTNTGGRYAMEGIMKEFEQENEDIEKAALDLAKEFKNGIPLVTMEDFAIVHRIKSRAMINSDFKRLYKLIKGEIPIQETNFSESLLKNLLHKYPAEARTELLYRIYRSAESEGYPTIENTIASIDALQLYDGINMWGMYRELYDIKKDIWGGVEAKVVKDIRKEIVQNAILKPEGKKGRKVNVINVVSRFIPKYSDGKRTIIDEYISDMFDKYENVEELKSIGFAGKHIAMKTFKSLLYKTNIYKPIDDIFLYSKDQKRVESAKDFLRSTLNMTEGVIDRLVIETREPINKIYDLLGVGKGGKNRIANVSKKIRFAS